MNNETHPAHTGFFARVVCDALRALPETDNKKSVVASPMELTRITRTEKETKVQSLESISSGEIKTTPLDRDILPVSASTLILREPTKTVSALRADTQPAVNVNAKVLPTHSSITDQQNIIESTQLVQRTTLPKRENKAPLTITMRTLGEKNAHSDKLKAQLLPTQTVAAAEQIATAPSVFSDISSAQEINRRVPVAPESDALAMRTPQVQVIAEPVLMPAELSFSLRAAPERKSELPVLRIGSITLRVVEAASAQKPAIQPVKDAASADPIASSESRHFLRTL